MRKIVLFILLLSIVFILGYAYTLNTDRNVFSKDNISFEYPKDWVVATPKNPDVICAVADPKSVNSSGFATVSVVIQKKKLNKSLYDTYQETYTALFSDPRYQKISESNVTFNGYQAIECIYLVSDGQEKIQRAVWIPHGDEAYIVLCTAPPNKFKEEKLNFDIVISTFKIS